MSLESTSSTLHNAWSKLFTTAGLAALLATAPNAWAVDPTICYAVSDGTDQLVTIKRDGTPTSLIGSVGVPNIEAITMSLDGDTVYAANQNGTTGQFGTLNTTTGAFVLIGNVGSGGGALGTIVFADIDGLAQDPWTGAIYGSVRLEATSTEPDVLIQIDETTGAHIPDAFGSGIDYVVIDSGTAVSLYDIDDLGIDPDDGLMYAVANNGGGNDRLIRVDKSTGAVVDVGRLRLADGTTIADMEGFSFSNDGTFYGTTGSATITSQDDRLWQIDETSGIAVEIAPFGFGSDYESLGCLTAGSNVISGMLFDDLDGDGVNDGEPGQGGVTVNLYIDENNDGLVDAGDTLINTVVTSAIDGSYSFEVAIIGNFVVDIDASTLPANTALTTDNVETASFTTFNNTAPDRDFGFAASADLQIVKSASPDPVSAGDTLTYTLTVTNNGPAAADDVIVTDTLSGSVTWVSTTPSQGSCSSPDGVICELGTLADGATATVTIVTTVN